jgi:Permuted papain-like amidase enzyme, YaeF/YiiX, C92 family
MFFLFRTGCLILCLTFFLILPSCSNHSQDIQHHVIEKSNALEPSYDFKPRIGDLFFQDLLGPVASAIETVTPGYNNAEVTHMGMIIKINEKLYILEAIQPEVKITSVSDFLGRSVDKYGRPRVFVGRLEAQFHFLIPAAIQIALNLNGLPYDYAYLPGEESYYCSELIVDAYKYANNGIEIFPEHPMSFRDLRTGKIPKFWIEYYKRLGIAIPEGELGSNPGKLSLSNKISIIHRYGFLTNWQ